MPGKKVLIVDVVDGLRKTLSGLVEAEGHRAIGAAGAAAALESIETERVDLVILDISGPGGEALALLRRVRKRWTRKEMPVVVVNAPEEEGMLSGAFDVGANECLPNPFSQREVRGILRRFLASTESERVIDEDLASFAP